MKNHWIQFKFRFNDDPTNPDWWMDLFLIDTAFRSIIEKYKPELWRFHRRSGNDGIGHQLSLLVCGLPILHRLGLESEISADLLNHHSVILLNEHNKIKSFSFELMEPGIEKTSDIHWPENIQITWPYFAKGACEMILGMMSAIPKYKKPKIESVYEIYYSMNDKMQELFKEFASHAFIHHLSALFGYPEILIRI